MIPNSISSLKDSQDSENLKQLVTSTVKSRESMTTSCLPLDLLLPHHHSLGPISKNYLVNNGLGPFTSVNIIRTSPALLPPRHPHKQT